MSVRFTDFDQELLNEALSQGGWELKYVLPSLVEKPRQVRWQNYFNMTLRGVLFSTDRNTGHQEIKILDAPEDDAVNQALQDGWEVLDFPAHYYISHSDPEYDPPNSDRIFVKSYCVLTRWKENN